MPNRPLRIAVDARELLGRPTGVGRYLRSKDKGIKIYAVEPAECALLSQRAWGHHGIEGIEYVESLKPLIAELPPRDRKILSLRFVAGMTQSEIGEELGISQMHVSRLLSRTLIRLRKGLTIEE